MVHFGNILEKVSGNRNPGWLFLSYNLDSGEITAVRRVAKNDPQWADWNKFVYEQVDRCFIDPARIPNERVYAFSFNKLESIPYLTGENNNHYIDFVSRSVPVYQLGILECGYAKSMGIEPTMLRADADNYNTYNEYVCDLQMQSDMALFKETVQADSENYELLYDLVARYTDVPEITGQQIEFLNTSPTGLRIFSVLEELFKSSEYVEQTLDFDNYEELLYTPLAQRQGVHYLKAELVKFDITSGRILADDPFKDKKVLELTLYIRRFEIKPDWETYGPEREWFSACVARMTDSETIAREFRNFSYLPALTRTQIQYLVRMGTTAETLFSSGIMGDVIMETPFFRDFFGLDLSGIQGRKLEMIDHLVIDSERMVVDSSLQWLRHVVSDPDETEVTRSMAIEKIPEVEGYLQLIDEFITRSENTVDSESEEELLAELRDAAVKVAEHYTMHHYEDSGNGISLPAENEILQILSTDRQNTALSEKQAELLLEFAGMLPVCFLTRCLTGFNSHAYGQLPENKNLSMPFLLIQRTLSTSLQKLSLTVECRRMQYDLERMSTEMEDKKRTERRIQNEINDLYDKINDCKADIRQVQRLLGPADVDNKTQL